MAEKQYNKTLNDNQKGAIMFASLLNTQAKQTAFQEINKLKEEMIYKCRTIERVREIKNEIVKQEAIIDTLNKLK